ncbi:MAG: hypothetical protein Q8906_05675 [Bacillota bacterium]|nr:hypothetical protein [Bacillota bacterium]MDP4170081.1 hypothetical protein [Bacillota bacterium]
MDFIFLKKRTLILFLITCVLALFFSGWLILKKADTVVFNAQSTNDVRIIHMVTGEYKSNLKNGKQIEAYRWDPGTIFLKRNEKVQLSVYGVNGMEHPFYIEGTSIKGTIRKGEELVVPLQFNKEGTYRLICQAHSDKEHNGPMIAYIVVN